MTRLILASYKIPEFTRPEFADLAAHFSFRFVWGPLPPLDEFATYLGPRATGRVEPISGHARIGALLDGLARCPAPVVSGLDEGPFTLEMHDDRDRHARYKQSRLSLTEFGQAVLAGHEDFSRHNPIHRWCGGTELTNDRLWRWDPVNHALIAP